jgi:thymidylate synthase (FAD)
MILVREKVDLFFNGESLDDYSEVRIGQFLETCGRICYRTEDKITHDSYKKFLITIIKSGHESVIEHVSLSAKILTNRAVTLETVRHRLGSYSQESTRYCNYSGDKFGNELTFIIPIWIPTEEVNSFSPEDLFRSDDKVHGNPAYIWWRSMYDAERNYLQSLEWGWRPEQAREILPNSLASTIMVTYNLRQWRHVLRQRLDKRCHPQMRYLMVVIGRELLNWLPFFFSDIVSLEQLDDIDFSLRANN